MLTYVRDYIGFKHSLFVKLCRIFKAIKNGKLETNGTSNFKQEIRFIIKNYIVPGIGYEV
jgi:hypothetical protein